MKDKPLQHRNEGQLARYFVLLAVGILFFLTLFPRWAPQLFVAPTGSIKIFSLGLTALLAVGLIRRVNWVRQVVIVLLALIAWLSWMWIENRWRFPDEFAGPRRCGWYVLLILSITGCVLLGTRTVRRYFADGA